MSYFRKFVLDTVSSPAGWLQILLALSSVFLIRTILELILDSEQSIVYYGGTYQDVIIYANAYISWLCTFLLLGLIFRFFLPLSTRQVFHLVTVFSPVICIVPVIDYLLIPAGGANIYYGHDWNDFLYNYLNLFNPFAHIKMVPPGVRIEILAVIASALVTSIFAFNLRIRKALLLAISVYSAIFFLGYLPAVYGLLFSLFGFDASRLFDGTTIYFYMYLPLFLVLLYTILLTLKSEHDIKIRFFIWFLYPSRLLFYLVSLGFGFMLAIHKAPVEALELIRHTGAFLSSCLAVIFLFSSAKILNDIHDIDIDRISNPRRPLASGEINTQQAGRLGMISLVFSLLFAVSINVYFLVIWGLIAFLSYIYSAPPIRLRRFYPFPNLIISAIGAMLFYAGHTIATGKITFPQLMSQGVIDKIFIAFFVLSHLKDAKDTEGDRANRIINVFNFTGYHKPLAILILAVFAIALYAISIRLEIDNIATLSGIVLFLVTAVLYISAQKDIRRFDHLFPASFVLLLYLTGIWLSHW